MQPLLKVRDLRIGFGTTHAVRGVSFDIAAGQTLALVGESGCGKSATALGLIGLLPDTSTVAGSIEFEGRELLTLPARERRALRGKAMSMIFQEPMSSLNPVISVGAQIVETLREHEALSKAAAWLRAIELLELVQIPEPHRKAMSYPHELSGGQRQRVMIAMAVACRPRLLIADEPTTALDVTVQEHILALLDTLRRELSMALLLITHDLGVVAGHADRVAVMLAGEKVEEAGVDDLFARPRHGYTRGLLGATLNLDDDLHYATRTLPVIKHGIEPSGRLTFEVMPGVAHTRISPAPDTGTPLLSVRDLRVDYPRRDGKSVLSAVDGVSFTIRRGETIGLVGESGCGKSTLSKAILRLIDPASGEIEWQGVDVARKGERALRPLRRQVQMIFQDPFASLNPRRSVQDILDTVLVVNGISDAAQRRARIADMIDRVGLPSDTVRRFPHEFSGGQRQRIGIARALIVRPDLLVCDEPVSALDVSIQAQILNLLVELRQELGLAYLFISHDLSVVRYMADSVHVMQHGKIVESGERNRIWQNPQHPYTQALLDAIPGKRAMLAA